MTLSTSTKVRSIGGASAIALAASFAVPAIAQSAPAPLAAAPAAPTAPTPPANTQQCVENSPGVFVCAPGVDPDGTGVDPFAPQGADRVRVIVQDGAFITGGNGSGFNAGVRLNEGGILNNSGAIITGPDVAAAINSGGVLNNLGYIESDSFFAINTNVGVVFRNSGTIYSANSFALIAGVSDSVLVNRGLLQADNGTVFLVASPGSTGTASVVNDVDGMILGAGVNAPVIDIYHDAEIENAGLIQSFGDGSSAISVEGAATLVNSGNIAANGDNLAAVQVGDGSDITNSGMITTSGAGAVAISASGVAEIFNDASGLINSDQDDAIVFDTSGSRLINNGSVTAANGNAVFAGTTTDITVVNNGTMTGRVGTIQAGDNLFVVNRGSLDASVNAAVATQQNLTLRNLGDITSDGITVRALGGAEIDNRGGSIISDTNSALLLGGSATITNGDGGTISGVFGINADGNADEQVVYNYGALSGTGAAALLGDGNDMFSSLNAGSETGLVDGGAGIDTLQVFVTDDQQKTFDLTGLDTQYINFERIFVGTQNFDPADNTVATAGTGDLVLSGQTSRNLLIRNSAVLTGELNGTSRLISVQNPGSPLNDLFFNIRPSGVIDVATNDGLQVVADGFTIQNNGLIRSDADEAIEAAGVNDLTVVNNGTIIADANGDIAIEANDNLFVVNRGLIQSISSQAIVATGTGLNIRNLVDIIGSGGNAVMGGDDVTIDNRGLIQADGDNAVELNFGTITNSGTIISTSSAAGELNAGIYFNTSADDSLITNEAGGLIEGDVGVRTDPTNTGAQTVVNFGTITGRSGTAVVIGAGDDVFQQWGGATVNGDVRLGAGDDTFVLEGTMSSILGTVSGAVGTDTAILGGTLDGDNLTLFENIQLGTMSDLQVSGARSLTGDVVFDGNVTFGLGVDSLAVDGNTTVNGGSTITVLTPLDTALLGQTVTVFSQTGTFTDNGGTFNIVDDDLLLDYTRVGNFAVRVGAVNALAGSGDRNVVALGSAVQAGIQAGTLSAGNFALLNGLSTDQFQTALLDALPSISEGPAREIFETSSAASDSLDRHLAGGGSGLWGQVIVRGAEQDPLSLSAAGYEADELIFTVGGDIAFSDNAKIGVLASYADIDIDDFANNSSSENSQVESMKLGAYVAVGLMDRAFFNAEVAYLTGDVSTSRSGFFGPITSGFDFDGITARATLGYDLLPDANVWLTPSIGVNAAKIEFDDVTEAGGFGFTVERGDAEFIELRGGIELGAQVSESVTGFVKGTIVHDTVDTVRSFRLTSSQLNTFFAELPLREQDRFELAAGLDLAVSETFTVGVGYQGDFNEGYSGHSARATVKIGF